MKMRVIRILCIFGLGGLIASSSFSYAHAYNPDTTHRPLSEKAVELYNASFLDAALTQQEKQWIAQGSVDEDAPVMRVVHHFYDPINNQGLQGFESSKQWARDSAMQGLNRFQLGGASGVFTWEEAIRAYDRGDKERAYKTLGHIFHLIQDKTVPAHVRQDPHPPFFKDELGGEDPYEHATENIAMPNIAAMKLLEYGNIDTYFDNVARYTNTHFLSKDSLGQYQQPSPTRVDTKYIYSIDNNSEYRIASFSGGSVLFGDDTKLILSDPLVIQDYWSRLAPKAIEANAGVLKLFHDTVGKQAANDQASAGDNIFISAFRALANSAQAVTLRVQAELRSAQELLSFFGANIAPGVAIGGDPNSMLPFNTTIANVDFQRNIEAQQSQQQFNQQVTTALTNPVYTSGQTRTLNQTQDALQANSLQQQSQPNEQSPSTSTQISISNTSPSSKPSSNSANTQTPSQLKDANQQKDLNINNTYRVSKVIDGDTISLTNGEYVRYIGIDAPEVARPGQTAECFSAEAKKRNEELVLNKDVRIENGPEARDAYGRMLGYIWVGDAFVNKKLIEEGYVRSFNFGHPHAQDAYFDAAQKQAKEAKLGLWTQCAKDKQKEDLEATQQQEENKENSQTQTQPLTPTNTKLVINEARIAGGEFVEIYNPTASATSLAGYFMAYYSQNRASWSDPWRNKEFPADAVIPARGYYIIAFGDFSEHFNWRVYTSDLLGNSAGAFALWKGDPKTSSSTRIDAMGWGDAILFEGSSAAPVSFTAASIIRWPSGADTNSNNQDFRVTKTMTPGGVNIFEQEAPTAGSSPAQDTQQNDTSQQTQNQTQQNSPAAPATPATIVINEIQTGDAEFIELYNTSNATMLLAGHYFAYYSSSKTAWNDPYRVKQFPDGASISGQDYYLIGLKDYVTTGGNPNADWQPYTSAQLANSGGTVAVFPFDPSTKSAQDAQAGMIDAVGWGNTILFEGAAAGAPEINQSIARSASHADTNNNAQDFSITITPNPKQNAALAQETQEIQEDDTAADDAAVVEDSDTSLDSDDDEDENEVDEDEDEDEDEDDGNSSQSPDELDEDDSETDEDSFQPLPLHIVINEIQTGDSEFVELYNPTDANISLDGYYFAYYSTSKTSWDNPWRVKQFPSAALISAGAYYLIGFKGYNTANNNPNADWQPYTSAQLANTGGTIAIFSQDPECAKQTPCAVTPIDAVAWGDVTSALQENTAVAAPTLNKSISRGDQHQDTDNNAQDFTQLDIPTPTNSDATPAQADFSGAPIWAMKYFNARHTNESTKNGPAWSASSDAKIKSQMQVAGYSFSISQPVIDSEGNSYLTTTVGSKSSVYSYDINGNARWYYDISTPDLRAPALSPDSQKLYVVSIGANTANSQGKLYVLQTSDGSLLASVLLGITWATSGGNHDATSPITDSQGNAYACTLRQCMAFDSGGTVLWTTVPNWGSILNISGFTGSSASVIRTPVLDANNLYVIVRNPNNDFTLLVLSLSDGAILWSRNMQSAPATGITYILGDPSLDASGILYAQFQTSQINTGVAAFDTQNGGAYLWKSVIASPSLSFKESPVVAGNGEIYSASYQQNKIYLFNTQGASKGTNKAVFTAPANISSLVSTDASGKVYVGDEAGNIYALQKSATNNNGNGNSANSDMLTVVWQYKLDSKVLSLVIGDGLVYAITNGGLMYVLGN
ncbi:MAG: lamin tail domain-containing protein [Candidatus Spechtbacteria bacterium]|nr:lamin tail domain-containing protein [Candidatus Spechtbacteria bacterium]